MEPIKVTIPTRVAQTLEKDAELFNIIKSNRTINKNKLYNLIIRNYQNLFRWQHNSSVSYIKNMFDNFNFHGNTELIHQLSKYIEEKQMLDEISTQNNSTIRIQINKNSVGYYEDFIDNFGNAYSSVSECLRRLFCSYASKPLNIREQIVFKETSDIIRKAIRSKKQIKFRHRDSKKVVYPYALVTSKEELYNYLLCKEIITDNNTHHQYGRLMSFRLTHISDVFIQNIPVEFSKTDIECLEATELLGPQYIVRTPNPQVKVLLNDEGIKQLERIYTHRPKFIEKNGHIYTFACTEAQANAYFSKFKRNAIVIEPKSLCEKMQKDFCETQKIYKTYLKKGIDAWKIHEN